ncbi:MAG: porin family protein [Rhizobiaceae bacterium]|nr:porin family protein [Rhizobiaceae bacterium]
MYRFVKGAFFAVFAAGAAVPAYSADLIEEPVIVPVVVGGWYIRGDIGMSNQYYDGLESDLFSQPFAFGWLDSGGFSAAPTFSVGLGYEFNDYFRGDVTVQWRGKSDFSALDWVEFAEDDPVYSNQYTGKKSELVFMANGYYDFGTFSGITPYVGAGIGGSYNTISHFTDVNPQNNGLAYADDDSQWNFAWALHTGVGFQATERMTLDLGYSFMSLGDARTGRLTNVDPLNNPDNTGVKFNDIYSHDFKLGIRYALN